MINLNHAFLTVYEGISVKLFQLSILWLLAITMKIFAIDFTRRIFAHYRKKTLISLPKLKAQNAS